MSRPQPCRHGGSAGSVRAGATAAGLLGVGRRSGVAAASGGPSAESDGGRHGPLSPPRIRRGVSERQRPRPRHLGHATRLRGDASSGHSSRLPAAPWRDAPVQGISLSSPLLLSLLLLVHVDGRSCSSSWLAWRWVVFCWSGASQRVLPPPSWKRDSTSRHHQSRDTRSSESGELQDDPSEAERLGRASLAYYRGDEAATEEEWENIKADALHLTAISVRDATVWMADSGRKDRRKALALGRYSVRRACDAWSS